MTILFATKNIPAVQHPMLDSDIILRRPGG
jgi:hypothetical protein